MPRRKRSFPQRIVSGGQTGVDRAALDVAIELDLPHGGWCPRGRLAEDGPIAAKYQLVETESPEYRVRTERNVLDSDATLILYRGQLGGGTELTLRLAKRHTKPWMLVDLDRPLDPKEVRKWLEQSNARVLNVAGPRESQAPGIGEQAAEYLRGLFGH